MKTQCFYLTAALLLGLGLAMQAAAQESSRLMRFPTTNSTDVVFTYGGDLYTVPLEGGTARRLTSHVGTEIFARFSPDGTKIAFTGQYDGNSEVYLMNAQGGEPVRLTYTATNSRDDMGDRMGPNNVVMTWSRDGKNIIYRNRRGTGFEGKLWSISPEGGMSRELPLPEGGFCSYSPDGKKLAYNRVFREFRTWKYYRGGMADDVWIYNPEAGEVQNITENKAQDIFPMWIGDEIFYLSDRDMTMNLFCYNTVTQETRKVTDFDDYDIKFPSTDGKIIVFEKGGFLFWFNPETRIVTQIEVVLNNDNIYARTERKDVSDYITGYSFNRDATRLVLTARGEVFDVPAKDGVTRNLSRTPGAHERDACYSPDGKYIAYISDRTGETELYLQEASEKDGVTGEAVQITFNNDTYIRGIQWAPDSKHILYSDRENRLVWTDPFAKTKKTLVQCPESEFRSYDISPDSKWLAYTRPAPNNFDVVYLFEIESGKEYPVTDRWYNSSSPVFSTDSRYLFFRSDRELNPNYGSLEWNHVFNSPGGLYFALLQEDGVSPFVLSDGEESEGDEAGDEDDSKDKKGKEAKKEEAGAKIQPDGIENRILKVDVGSGWFYGMWSDGKTLWYSRGGSVHAYNLEEQEDVEVVKGGYLVTEVGSKKALVLKDDNIYVLNSLPVNAVSPSDPVDLSRMIAVVDYPQEWAQIFDEAWRAYRDGFYLANMHDVDWKAIRAKYEVLLPYVKTRLDLNYVIGEMIGELATGHAYVNPGEYKKAERVSTGLLGAELSRDETTGFFRIDRILQGAVYDKSLRSPLREPGLKVKEGDYITAIDGISTATVPNIYELLVGKAGVRTELALNAKPAAAGSRKIVVKPIGDEEPLYHYEWIQKNIKRVDEATNGRVGYIYIPDMGPEGLREFARYFYPQLDKEGLIIDDRGNGGGNISPMIIERLLRKPYRMTMYRGSSVNGLIPDATQYGPKVLLINKYSASDGDLFPWSFKANKLGTVIGTRSWGGIVGISGSLPYMDGTDIRVPFFTNYDVETGEWIIENHGVDPDILIDNNPIREFAGEDEQLEKAIETVLEQLKDRKALPKTPKPRTLKDLTDF